MKEKKHYPDAEIKRLAKRYPRVIRWDEQDQIYIGSLPDLDGDCTHGKTVEEVALNLDECAELAVETSLEYGLPLPEPRSKVVVPSPFKEWDNTSEVARLRKQHGVSQKDFANMLGVSFSTLAKWESGERKPSGASAKLLDIIRRHPELV